MDLTLYPYALHQETHMMNFLMDKGNASSSLERFFNTSITPKIKKNNAFGCPFFALHIRLVGGRVGVPKWEPRARLGINLGPSPRHAGSVSLEINLHTAMVSPKSHLVYYDLFKTVRPTSVNPPVCSNWQALTGLRKHEQTVIYPKIIPPKRLKRPEAIIIWDAPPPSSEERGK